MAILSISGPYPGWGFISVGGIGLYHAVLEPDAGARGSGTALLLRPRAIKRTGALAFNSKSCLCKGSCQRCIDREAWGLFKRA